VQATDEEAVEAHQLARPFGLDVAWRRGLARRLVGRAVAGDERQPSRPRREPVPAQAAPDAVVRDEQAAPTRARELGGDPARPQAGVAEREGDDSLLDQRRELVGHLRAAPLARAQHLEPVPVDLRLPAVVRRAVDAEAAAGG
jgi:hypothetical protein